MGLSRRDFLRAALVGGAAVSLPIAEWARSAGAGGEVGKFTSSPEVGKFVDELRPVTYLRPETPTHGVVPWSGQGPATVPHFEIEQAITMQQILPGKKTPVASYNGSTPGPFFKVRDGQPIAVTHHNRLHSAPFAPFDDMSSFSTSTHLHGARIKAKYDGHPVFNRCEAGASLRHFYPNHQPAITMWYHDHNFADTGAHVWSGLAAMYLLVDAEEQALIDGHGLPAEQYDIPMVLQDKRFNPDNTVVYEHKSNDDPLRQGMFGDIILVNGQPFPKLSVEPRKYRFRILNGSNARFYNLRLSTGDAFTVVQTDGGLIPRRADTTELFISQAERYSIVVDFSKYVGKRVILENTIDPDPFGDPVPKGTTSQIMAFDVVKPLSSVPDVTVPDTLTSWLPYYNLPIKSVQSRKFVFERGAGMWVINGKPYEKERIDAEPVLNTTEVWEIVNSGGAWLHPVHIHLVEFRMLERNGRPIKNFEQGPKDVIALGPNESVKIAVNFDGDDFWFDDDDVRTDATAMIYPMHCHNLEHEDHDMMTQFRVKRR